MPDGLARKERSIGGSEIRTWQVRNGHLPGPHTKPEAYPTEARFLGQPIDEDKKYRMMPHYQGTFVGSNPHTGAFNLVVEES